MHATAVTVTLAVDESDPNKPKAKPAMATPATRVIAMRMTVARTGEIAFLFFVNFVKFIAESGGSTIPLISVGERKTLKATCAHCWRNIKASTERAIW
jgi:hypothetical protein